MTRSASAVVGCSGGFSGSSALEQLHCAFVGVVGECPCPVDQVAVPMAVLALGVQFEAFVIFEAEHLLGFVEGCVGVAQPGCCAFPADWIRE